MKNNTDDAVEQVIEARGQTETCHQFCTRNTKTILIGIDWPLAIFILVGQNLY